MKKAIYFLLTSAVLFFGCSTTENPVNYPLLGYASGIVLDGADIYISGNVGIDYEKGAYWLNGSRTDIGNLFMANGIFRDAGSTYIFGSLSGTSGRYPAFWAGGSNHTIGSDYGRIQGGFISGGSSLWLFSGYYLNGSVETPCYWSNDNRISLAGTARGKSISVLQTNGIQYFAGYVYSGSVPLAQLWTNGPVALTLQPLDTNYESGAAGLFSDGTRWYVSGYSQNASSNMVPCFWTNTNVRIDLPSGSRGGGTLAITVDAGSRVYISGFTNDINGVFHPALWTNGSNLVALNDNGGGGAAYSIVLSGSDIYSAGYVFTNGSIAVPCWWSNTNLYYLPVK